MDNKEKAEISELLSSSLKNTPFYSRPLCFVSAVFLVLLFFRQSQIVTYVFVAALILAFAVFISVSGRDSKKFKNPLAYALVLIVILSAVLPIPNEVNYRKVTSLDGEVIVKAVVRDTYYEEAFGSSYVMQIKEIDGKRYFGNSEAVFHEQTDFSAYDTVTFTADISDARAALEGTDVLNAKSKELCVHLEVKSIKSVTNEARKGIAYFIDSIRYCIGDRLALVVDAPALGYAKALLIGDRSDLSDEFRTDMSALGVSHILAVSGMHMSMISMIAIFLAERARASRKTKSVLIILSSIAFMGIAGFSPSVNRAAIMLCISMLAVFAGGRSDVLTSLFFSCALICAISPESVLSCSLLLSFFATLGIALCAVYAESYAARKLYRSRAGDMKRAYAVIRCIAFSFLVTLCATLFTAPVMALYFGEISFFALIINPVAIPMAFGSMLLTVLVAVFADFPFVGAALGDILELLYSLFSSFAKVVSNNFTTSVSLRYPFFFVCIALLLSALIFLWIRKVRNPLALIAVFTVCAIVYASSIQIYGAVNSNKSEIIYLGSKTSEGFVVNSENKTMYIDVGNGSKVMPSMGVNYAKSEYYETYLDAYMLTHYHSAHIGTMKRMLIDVRIKTLYLPYPETENEKRFYENILMHTKECEIINFKRGEIVRFGDIKVQMSDYCLLERSGHPVMIMKISANERAITYLGSSASESGEVFSAERFIAESDVIICGNHGPSPREDLKYYSYGSDMKVYLSPFGELDEEIAFRDGSYHFLQTDEDGTLKAKFSF